MKALFLVGQCVRLLNQDPWLSPTLHIQESGRSGYLVELAQQRASGWAYGDGTLSFTIQQDYEILACPDINWNTK
jgi:hypothetical protein